MRKLIILIGVSLLLALAYGNTPADSIDVDGATPRLPQPGEFSIWDDGTAETFLNMPYISPSYYDGFGKLSLANQDWAIEEDLQIEAIHTIDYGSTVPMYEYWAVCGDDNGYPADFMSGEPWIREYFQVGSDYWNTYTFSRPVTELAEDEEFWVIVNPEQDYGEYIYYGYDTDNWYSRSYVNLHNYYDWEQTIGIFGSGELTIRVYGDIDTTIEQTSLGQIKSLFE